jgi:hypothetical protein
VTAARLTARAGSTDKTSEALPVVPGEVVPAGRRSNFGAEGGAPLTDFADDGGAAARVGAHKNQLTGWRRLPLGGVPWTCAAEEDSTSPQLACIGVHGCLTWS